MELLIHNQTKARIEQILLHPPHAIVLIAASGMGKATIAKYVAAGVLNTDYAKLDVHPYFRHIQPEKSGSISIEDIRKLRQFLNLKTHGRSSIRRVVVIEGAGKMTTEAQNALLKVLEEPPEDTMIVMTATSSRQLLPTILSRATQLGITQPLSSQTLEHFSHSYDKAMTTQAFHVSDGRPGLMQSVLDSKENELTQYVTLAKELIKSTRYERLVRINELTKPDIDLSELLEALYITLHAVMLQSIEQNNRAATARLQSMCKKVSTAQESLRLKPSAKMLLTDLFLEL